MWPRQGTTSSAALRGTGAAQLAGVLAPVDGSLDGGRQQRQDDDHDDVDDEATASDGSASEERRPCVDTDTDLIVVY